jgi:hypothetical protein
VIRFNQRILVLSLAACLLLMSTLAATATVSHESQHSHHQAATHMTPLCSWLCGAGQGYELTDTVFVPTISFLAILDIESIDQIDDVESIFSPSRSPPSFSS